MRAEKNVQRRLKSRAEEMIRKMRKSLERRGVSIFYGSRKSNIIWKQRIVKKILNKKRVHAFWRSSAYAMTWESEVLPN